MTQTSQPRREFHSGRGRKTFDRVPGGFYLVGALVILFEVVTLGAVGLALAVGDPSEDGASPDKESRRVEVTYIATGDHPSVDLTVGEANSHVPYGVVILPYRKTVTLAAGADFYLDVRSREDQEGGTLTCTVLVDGKVVQQAHSTPDSSSATCAGSTANSPQRGIPVPTLTPGASPLPEERRLTGTVKVRDYPGEGSPVIGTVTDSSLEYAELGGTWDRSKTLDPVFDGFTRKQEGRQRALVKSTQVDEDIMAAAGGTGELRGVAGAVMDERRRYEYPRDQAILVDVASQPLKVDGHDAWLLVSEIHFHKRGVPSTMDLNAVLVVDTGRVRPSVLWVVLPETNKKLWPDLNTLVASVQVR
jgi:predicted RecA/RadA family phage recombinase